MQKTRLLQVPNHQTPEQKDHLFKLQSFYSNYFPHLQSQSRYTFENKINMQYHTLTPFSLLTTVHHPLPASNYMPFYYYAPNILFCQIAETNDFLTPLQESESQNLQNSSPHEENIKQLHPKQRTLRNHQRQVAQNKVEKTRISSKVNKHWEQKENRNVISNIMRIFFKYIFQTDVYDRLIHQIIHKFSMKVKLEVFYDWLKTFFVNYKSFVRHSEVIRACKNGGNINFQKILKILIRHYMSGDALNHCLCSKRIKSKAIRIHIQGIRTLKQSLQQ